jgi:membrane fusion protein, multidrug efflux system
MSGCSDHRTRSQSLVLLTAPVFVFLTACQPDAETPAPQPRPVRTVTVVKRDVGETVSYTGRIEAEDEARLAFRIAGRMVERSVNVGDQVGPGQIVAKLEPHNQLIATDCGGRCRGGPSASERDSN